MRPAREIKAAHEAGRHAMYPVSACPLCPRCGALAPIQPVGVDVLRCGRVRGHSGNHSTPIESVPQIW
jgi:hypothetical protein